MEYGSRQHGDASGVAGQLPMPLSKFQSNVISGSRTLGSVGSSSINNKHQMISEKKMFEGQDIIVGQHQLLQVKPSLPATAATSTSGSSTASSTSSMKKFFGRNKGFVCVYCAQLYAYVHMYVSICVCSYPTCVCSVCSCVCLCLSV